MRKYGNQPFISFRKLSKASGISVTTIMKLVKMLEKLE